MVSPELQADRLCHLVSPSGRYLLEKLIPDDNPVSPREQRASQQADRS